MNNVCCKEFTGWFKSFTKIERALAVLEAVLLVVLIVVLILVILHLIVCSNPDYEADATNNKNGTTPNGSFSYISANDLRPNQSNITATLNVGQPNEITEHGIKCSWTPSAKTTAVVHYYENGATENSKMNTKIPEINGSATKNIYIGISTSTKATAFIDPDLTTQDTGLEDLIHSELSDGEEAEDKYRSHVVALVKLKPPKDIIFGCILTIVSEYWTLTAASCIEVIEEIDSLDSFVIMEQYGTNKKGPVQIVEDVQIHPLYEGKNKSYDLAALKSGGSLIKGPGSPVKLASLLDSALVNLAERFIILGYGAFRSIDKSPSGRGLRQTAVYSVPAWQCGGGGGGAGLRHLWAGRAAPAAACCEGAVCAGVLYSRAPPCNYCAGTPLLRAARLLGIMADNQHCGVACEPQLYVNVAENADWIDATVRGEFID